MDKKNIFILILILIIIFISGISLFFLNLYGTSSLENHCNVRAYKFYNLELDKISNVLEFAVKNNEEIEFTIDKINFDSDLASISNMSSNCISKKDDYENSLIKIERFSNTKKCESICGVSKDSCFTTLFFNLEIPNGFSQKCISIPEYTSLMSNESCEPIAGYDLADPFEKLDFGDYAVKNVSEPSENNPKLCIYYKLN